VPEEKLQDSVCVTFKDNTLLPVLYGDQDKHLLKLEKQLGVTISSRGNVVSISGDPKKVYISETVLKSMYHKLQNGMDVPEGEFDALIRMISENVTGQRMMPTEDETKAAAAQAAASRSKRAEVDEKLLKQAFQLEETKEKKREAPMASDNHYEKPGKKIALEVVTAEEKRNARAERAEAAEGKSGGRARPAEQQSANPEVLIKTQRKNIIPYTNRQVDYIRSLLKSEVVFASGPAGTGKTYVAVAAAVNLFLSGEVDRIILTRPAVEAGEKLGFLPGDMKEKVDPYLRPLYDALYDMMPAEKVLRCIENGEIEIAPLAFMRGRTLRYAFVILDEAQNTTPTQMKMFLTRLGEGSRMAITGDLSQTDLPKDIKSGFRDAIEKLKNVEEIKIIKFGDADIVRHPLTVKIVQAYESNDKRWE
jgi:phosphate starvation-inducible PhoH-like protein